MKKTKKAFSNENRETVKPFSNENGETVKPFSNENTQKASEPQLKRGRKRNGASFDTGTAEGQNTRFQAVKTAILTGGCPPSVRQIMKRFSARYEVARDFLAELAKQGVLIREQATGTYSLVKK